MSGFKFRPSRDIWAVLDILADINFIQIYIPHPQKTNTSGKAWCYFILQPVLKWLATNWSFTCKRNTPTKKIIRKESKIFTNPKDLPRKSSTNWWFRPGVNGAGLVFLQRAPQSPSAATLARKPGGAGVTFPRGKGGFYHGFTMDLPWICHGFTHPPNKNCACNVWIARFFSCFSNGIICSEYRNSTVLGSGPLTSGEDSKGRGRLGTWRPDTRWWISISNKKR